MKNLKLKRAKIQRIIFLKKELIDWLDSECPESIMTYDLSHDFAEKLRERLNELKKELK